MAQYKVCIIGPAYPLRGGIATFDEIFCQELNKAGHSSEVVSFSLQYPGFLFPGTTQYNTSGSAPAGIRIHSIINSVNPFSWWKTARFIKKQKPDFVVIRFWIPFMGPALGTIARLIRKKGIKVIAITDNVVPHEKRPGDIPLTRYFIKSCQGFVTLSQSVLESLSLYTNTTHKKMLVHPLFNTLGEIQPKAEARKKLGIPEQEKVILFFGLIRKYKGLDLLLQAMADPRMKASGVKLLIAGEFYDDKAYYDQIIQEHQLSEQIILHNGFVANEDIKYYFSACDLLTLTYHHATQSGVTQVAFQFDKPVLVTNVGGLGEVIPDGKCGYVVEREPQKIADAILDFYEQHREAELTEGMREEKKKYAWAPFINEVIQLYKEL